jgi:hypothetical protein
MVDMEKTRTDIFHAIGERLRNDLFCCDITVFSKNGVRGCNYIFVDDEVKEEIPVGSEREKHDTPFLSIGEEYKITLHAKRNGYVHVFNFGSSGAIDKMFPIGDGPSNAITVDIPLEVSNYSTDVGWEELGPNSSSSGKREGILVVETKERIELSEGDLHFDLIGAKSPMTRGDLGNESTGISDLYSKPDDEVFFAYYEFEIRN